MISKLFRSWLIIGLTLIWCSSNAQISYNGTPIFKSGNVKSVLNPVNLPRFEIATMINARKGTGNNNNLKHAQYAYRYNVSFNSEKSGYWEELDDGRKVWRIAISSPGAYSLGVIFSRFKLPAGGQVFVYNTQSDQVLGAYTEKNNKTSGRFSIEPLEGDELYIEYIEPLYPEFSAELEIGAVLHDYKNIFNQLRGEESQLKASGSCNVNINCSEGDDWQTEKQSVCHILYGGWVASGTLINNTNFDGRPFLLTAHHVIDTQEDADVAIFYFNYEAADCESSFGSKSQSISGSSLLSTSTNLDFTLLELSVMPPASYSPYFAGWDRSGRVPLNTTCIHHPNGDVKKISIDYDAPVTDSYSDTKYTFDVDTHWRIVEWDVGTTEGGSSGAPLFDENHRIIGNLTGGEASCSNSVNDYFAKFSESWANYTISDQQLKFWLDPLGLEVETLAGLDPYGDLQAMFIANEDTCCISSQVTLTDLSPGDPTEYYWDFGDGAMPGFSTEKGPHSISYSSDGTKLIKLVVRKDGFADSLITNVLIVDFPVADFDYSIVSDSITMINNSISAMFYTWDFGDGELSNLLSPTHVYAQGGNYLVNLTVENVCGSDSKSVQVQNSYEDQLRIYPNPSRGLFTADVSHIVFSQITWIVYDLRGAQIRSGVISSYDNTIDFSLKGMSAGLYVLKLDIDGVELKRKLLLVD